MKTITQLHTELVADIKSIKSAELNNEFDKKLAGWDTNPENYLKLLKILFNTSDYGHIGTYLNFITTQKTKNRPQGAQGYYEIVTPYHVPYIYLGYLLSLNKDKEERKLAENELEKDENYLISIYNEQIVNSPNLSKKDYIDLIHYLAKTNEANTAFKQITDQIAKNTENNMDWNFDKSSKAILQLLATENGYQNYIYPLFRIENGNFPSYFSNLVLQCYAYNDNEINNKLKNLLSSYSGYIHKEITAEELKTQLISFHQFIHNDKNYSKSLNEERNKEIVKELMIAIGVFAILMFLASTLVVFPLALVNIIAPSLALVLIISGAVTSSLMGVGTILTGIFATLSKTDAPVVADRITTAISSRTGIKFFDEKIAKDPETQPSLTTAAVN